uniref:Uncharacterized protein n=1 Tax=Anguilla anguilla TaxID=7936 RepID=A0A0E9UT13_ANGAN
MDIGRFDLPKYGGINKSLAVIFVYSIIKKSVIPQQNYSHW